MVRGAHLLLRLSAALAAGVAIGVAVLWWRLASGPLSLDFLTPWVQEALASPGQGIGFVVEHTELTIDPDRHTVEVLADGARIMRTDGRNIR